VNADTREFVDLQNKAMTCIFKLYPWEWMMAESFARTCLSPRRYDGAAVEGDPEQQSAAARTVPDVPGEPLHPACRSFEPFGDTYAAKPIHAREGANITLTRNGITVASSDGDYGDMPCVYQALCMLPNFDGNYPVVGSWLVNGYACGMGIREDKSLITANLSRFVPHLFVPA